MNQEDKNELKKRWKFYLLFGVAIIIINTLIQVSLTNYINERMQGPPCRIEFSEDIFPMINSTYFNLQYLLVNLRDKDLLIENIENWCYWESEEKTDKNGGNIIIEQPIMKEIPAPAEFEKLTASKTEVKTAFNCKSPTDKGTYKVKIFVKTTKGTCEGKILMEVIKK